MPHPILDLSPDWLACPICHRRLELKASQCLGCGRVWPLSGLVRDLIPVELTPADWTDRLRTCSAYYRQLREDPIGAASAFRSDLQLFGPELSECGGRVLDVGGGHGLAREFIPLAAEYASIDPDPGWLDPAWNDLGPAFPSVLRPLMFVRGIAEALPSSAEAFDQVLTMFTLNHCADPHQVCREVARVLRRGGRWLLVLEDVEPSWPDVWSLAYRDWRGWSPARMLVEKALARLAGWPTEADHVRITERDVDDWTRDQFVVARRSWRRSYRLLDLTRR